MCSIYVNQKGTALVSLLARQLNNDVMYRLKCIHSSCVLCNLPSYIMHIVCASAQLYF